VRSVPPLSPETRRDVLVALGMPIVARVASRIARRVPRSIARDDLFGAGAEGLVRAIAGYDPSHEAGFEPYAEARIRGAILDELRAGDVLSRRARAKAAHATRTAHALERELGRAPSDEEIARALDIDVDRYRRVRAELAHAPALTHGGVEPDTVACRDLDPEHQCAKAEERARLRDAIDRLSARSRDVLERYYEHEQTQAEIGRALGVSESRVCQILSGAAAELRRALA
jgi:RNA polymerase sigma factor for flagellar operon FliA